MLLRRFPSKGPDFPNLSNLSTVNGVLREYLAAVDFSDPSSRELLEEISSFQDEDGSFKYFDVWDIPSDARVDFCYMPTYICASILMKYRMYRRESGDGDSADLDGSLARALEASCGRRLSGHGYEAEEGQISALRVFIMGGLKRFVVEDPRLCLKFTETIREIVSGYSERVAEGETLGAWGEDYGDGFREVLKELGPVATRYYLAYGRNMNLNRMKERCPTAVRSGATYLKDFRLRFNLHATIEPAAGERVPALLWELRKADEKNWIAMRGWTATTITGIMSRWKRTASRRWR